MLQCQILHRLCFFCADFGASLDLQAREKDNFVTDNHAVACMFCVTRGWKEVDFDTMDENNQPLSKKTIIIQCHLWVAFVDSAPKVKKNDHAKHSSFMQHAMKHHKENSELRMSNIKKESQTAMTS